MSDPYRAYRPMLALIGKAEGTDPPRGRGYNETLGYGAYTDGAVDLVGMTLAEIDALQTAMLRHPANRWNSSAAGRYQIVRTTLRQIKQTLKLRDSERFNEAMQDRCACFLLGRRGIDRWLDGQMSEGALINGLAKEWASLPTTSGEGHYAGQGTGATISEVRAALAATRQRAEQQPQPPPSADQPSARGWTSWDTAIVIIIAMAAGVAAFLHQMGAF